ncbi:MAG: DUF1080 domain-containing protein [Dysgonamonadaceae bacterium]|jgi:hypothetical protein|nr:DUF1080 domain-containing protein [Dysgonamonadaceae bacterium]
MKKVIYTAMAAALLLTSCGGNANRQAGNNESSEVIIIPNVVEQPAIRTLNDPEATATVFPAQGNVPEYRILDNPQMDLSLLPVDDEGYIVLFDGLTFNGWRGYGRPDVPGKWTIEDGTMKFNGAGTGEAQTNEGGDIIFAHQFSNFEFSIDWKVSRAGNSGIFYLAQEVEARNREGNWRLEPIYISAPESQILDNEHHMDALAGANRMSSSLYDMIAADPQNANPYGEWNNTRIIVDRGNVLHFQNGERVVSYNLGNQKWTDMLQASKFREEAWPLAFTLLNKLGRETTSGYFGLQDHGDDVWFRNIRVKLR